MEENRCVVCNETIPEGRMICPSCEKRRIKVGMFMQTIQATEEEVTAAYNEMEDSNDI